MRRHEFTTLIDPFEARFGRHWAAVLFVPAMFAEVFWSAELLVAIGSTFGAILDMDLRTAILVSAVVVTAYTVLGGHVVGGVHRRRSNCVLVVVGLTVAVGMAAANAGRRVGDLVWLRGRATARFVDVAAARRSHLPSGRCRGWSRGGTSA